MIYIACGVNENYKMLILNRSYMGNSVGRYRLTDEDLKTNFNKIKDDLGHVPLFSEFRKLSKISDTTYANRLGLKDKLLTDHGIKIIRIDSRMNWQDKNKLKDYLMSQLV